MPKIFLSIEERREYARNHYNKHKSKIDFIEKRKQRVKNYRNKNREKYNEQGRKYYKNKSLEEKMFDRAKKRAKRLNLEFNLELCDIFIPKKCPISNIELFHTEKISSKHSPSLDRIDNNKGYIKGNVHVISNQINTLKNNLLINEIESLYYYLKEIMVTSSRIELESIA